MKQKQEMIHSIEEFGHIIEGCALGDDGGGMGIIGQSPKTDVPTSPLYRFICSWGGDWDHVSISILNIRRCPTWEEMCWVKGIFWKPEEAVMQLHPAASEYVNTHPLCLHLWRPQTVDIPSPPKHFVG